MYNICGLVKTDHTDSYRCSNTGGRPALATARYRQLGQLLSQSLLDQAKSLPCLRQGVVRGWKSRVDGPGTWSLGVKLLREDLLHGRYDGLR